MDYVVTCENASPSPQIGGKASALAQLSKLSVPVPRWIALSSEAFYASLNPAQKQALQLITEENGWPEPLNGIALKDTIQRELQKALEQLCPENQLVAVRSSAPDEDSGSHSYAGQLESYLFVHPTEVCDKVVAVWRSGFSAKVIAYRKSRGLSSLPEPPAVLIQLMIYPDISGVAFSADPISGNRENVVISSLYGLGSALVTGECDADTLHLDRNNGVIRQHIAHKPLAYQYQPDQPERTGQIQIPAPLCDQSCLSTQQALFIANQVRILASYFYCPQDMEWAIAQGQFYVLQSRPVTSPLNDETGRVFYIWGNYDLESWSGVTTPITFTFLRRMYTHKYQFIGEALGTCNATIQHYSSLYPRLLGLIEGRIFFNKVIAYEIWKLVPGFLAFEPLFLEYLDGEKPEEREPAKTPPKTPQDYWHLIRLILTLLYRLAFWDKQIQRFQTEVHSLLETTMLPFDKIDFERLVILYYRLETVFSLYWKIPTLNNYYALVFYTLLGKITHAWCNDEEGTLRNDLISNEGDITSAQAILCIRQLAEKALHYPDLLQRINTDSEEQIFQKLHDDYPEFYAAVNQFIFQYGNRCHEDLKLETPNIADNPLGILRAIAQYANRFNQADNTLPLTNKRHEAEETVKKSLQHHPIRKALFYPILALARARMQDRENMRFLQTCVMGRLRLLFRAIGNQFEKMDLLEHPSDIVYLEIEEILGFAEGSATCTSLKALATLRKREFESYHLSEGPGSTFTSIGSAYFNQYLQHVSPDPAENNDQQAANLQRLKGLGCCPGIVEGVVCFTSQLAESLSSTPIILAAECGDPGLALLLPSVSGLLLERGSPLSHLAIVAREMGIPTIIALPGLMQWLQSGDVLRLDGKTGWVEKAEPVPSQYDANSRV